MVEFDFIANVLKEAGAGEEVVKASLFANTAREIFFIIKDNGLDGVFEDFASLVKKAGTEAAIGMNVDVVLVGYEKEIVVKV
jgi:cobalamin biosynthesis protein CbiD